MDLETLYEKYFDFIYLRCFRLVGNKQVAEELCQEVFVRANQSLYRFVPRASHKTWLYKIATNVCLNHLDLSSTRNEIVSEELPEARSGNDTEGFVIKSIFEKKLNPEEQQYFVYRYVDGMTHEEIASVMKCSRRKVIQRVQDLSAKFKELYNG